WAAASLDGMTVLVVSVLALPDRCLRHGRPKPALGNPAHGSSERCVARSAIRMKQTTNNQSGPRSQSRWQAHGAATLACLLACVRAQTQQPAPGRDAAPRIVHYQLVISETQAEPAGTPTQVLVVNGTSPGPVLR